MSDQTLKSALARYHAVYDNTTYTHIRRAVVNEVVATDTDPTRYETHPTVVTIMNDLIDTCLECCGAEHYTGAHIRLARSVAQVPLCETTIAAIYRYLNTFPHAAFHIASDFHAVTCTLLTLKPVPAALSLATASASDVHSWQGRTAYHLLAAAASLVTTAESLLTSSDDTAYMQEKLYTGLTQLQYALREGTRYSPDADAFRRIVLTISPDNTE